MILWLTDQQAQTIIRHLQEERPQEGCGLLIGSEDGQVIEIIPAKNVAQNPQRHYEIEHHALVDTMTSAQKHGLELLGFYHSHPNGDPIPSSTDVAQANYPDAAYLIVGFAGGAPKLAAWRIRRHEVERLELHVGDSMPVTQDAGLSGNHKFAIIVSAIFAFVFMIVLSLSLLPPAPEIP